MERYIETMIRIIVCSERFLLISTKVLTGESAISKIKKRIKNFQKI